MPIEAIECAIVDLDTLVGGMQVGATWETLDGMLSYARQCLACSAAPVIVSAGIRYKNEDGQLAQMKRYRLGGLLVRQSDGHPLDRLDYLKDQAPSFEVMQWQIRPEVSVYLRTLPRLNRLAQAAFHQRLNRAFAKLTEEKLLQLVPLILEGDDYDILHLS